MLSKSICHDGEPVHIWTGLKRDIQFTMREGLRDGASLKGSYILTRASSNICLRISLWLLSKVYEPNGPSGRSLSRFQKHEAIRSISTPPLDGMLVHFRVTPSIKFAGIHLRTWVEKGTANSETKKKITSSIGIL